MGAFSFIQITDHHLYDSEEKTRLGLSPAARFRAVLRHIAEHHREAVDFIISTGDLVEDPTRKAYEAVGRMLNLRGEGVAPPGPLKVTIEGLQDFPFYLLPGNHDEPGLMQQIYFPGVAPRELYNASFLHRGVRFHCLDWGNASKGKIREETLAFLEEQLSGGEPAVLLNHHQIVPVGAQWLDRLLPRNLERFWSVLEGKNVLGVLSGHLHLSYERIVRGLPVLGLGATTFSFARTDEPLLTLDPPQYRLLTVHEGVLTSRIFHVPMD